MRNDRESFIEEGVVIRNDRESSVEEGSYKK